VQTVADPNVIPSVFYYALAARSSFQLNGSVIVDSSPILNVGNVHSNQNVDLIGTSLSVAGRVTASGVVNGSTTANVTGGMYSGVPPMAFPAIEPEFEAQALVNGTTVPSGGTLNVNNASTLVQGKISGNLNVGKNGCQISGVVWVTGSVSINGPVTGKGTLVCDGTLSISAGGAYPSGDLSNLLFMTTSVSDVDLGGNGAFKGIVYAPNSTVRFHGTPHVIGGIICNTITFSGTPGITKWTSFLDNPPPFPKVFTVRGWQEL
jgi:hypothetical protein